MEKTKKKIETSDILFEEYDWFKKLFPLALQKSSDGFFQPGLRCELIGISKNINLLQTKEPYFVTKVKIDKFYDMFLRISGEAAALLLNKGLGKLGRTFNINKLSELEGKVLTGFNDYVYKIIIQFFDPPPVVNFVRTNFDVTHLTFIIKNEENGQAGKFIISIPDGRLSPKKVELTGDKFDYPEFYECHTDAHIEIGKTRFSVKELKDLESGDLIVLEDSNIQSVTLHIMDETKTVLLEPNMNINLPFDENNGGNEMGNDAETKNLWDSIEVDMYAEINPVKISLGNLKKIEEGLVIDVAALYDNQVTLRVENKVIGHGELVIVNDRYGVKITSIEQKKDSDTANLIQEALPAPTVQTQPTAEKTDETSEYTENESGQEQIPMDENAEGQQPAGDEDFDYSDFELEDEDI